MAAHFNDKDDDLWYLAELYLDLFPPRQRLSEFNFSRLAAIRKPTSSTHLSKAATAAAVSLGLHSVNTVECHLQKNVSSHSTLRQCQKVLQYIE